MTRSCFLRFWDRATDFMSFDGVFHSRCFDAWGDRHEFARLHAKFRRIMNSRPRNVSMEEAERWLQKHSAGWMTLVRSERAVHRTLASYHRPSEDEACRVMFAVLGPRRLR